MAAALKELDDVTECSICTEVFTDPRIMPCVHTYCLKCILGWANDKSPGDKLACPLCRKESTIPDDGLQGLPRNFFIEKMLRIKELTIVPVQPTPCDLCATETETGATPINSATNYCVQCQENYCKQCASVHRKHRLLRDHKLLQIGDKVNAEELLAQYPPANCDKHVDKPLEIFCNDCRQVICLMCYIEVHSSHKCSNINEVVDEFRKRMSLDVTSAADGVTKCKQMLQMLASEKQDFDAQVGKTEREIHENTKQLRQIIDRHEASLLDELKSIEKKRTKEMETTCEEIERLQTSMESYIKYVGEIREKGAACDIASAASALHDRADELLKFDVIERTLSDLGHAVVTLAPSTSLTDDAVNTVGALSVTHAKPDVLGSGPPRLTKALPGDRGVCAVTSLGDRVYAVMYNEKGVDVYDIDTLTPQRSIPVPQISYASGIAGCDANKCLYLSHWYNSSIVRVDLSTGVVKAWPVAANPAGLSMTSDRNVLVTCLGGMKLQEYTTDGRLVREICLQSDTKSPWHAVQLSTGQYVVSQYTSHGVVSIVGADGRVVRSYGQSPSSDARPMKFPRSIAVTNNGDVLVADEHNDRILAINSSFTRAQELLVPKEIALQHPFGLFLDESRDRLYIGEMDGNYRVIVLDNVLRITWK